MKNIYKPTKTIRQRSYKPLTMGIRIEQFKTQHINKPECPIGRQARKLKNWKLGEGEE